MRLELDLGFDAGGLEDAVAGRRIGFHRLAAAIRSRAELRVLLRDRGYEELEVRLDGLPLSAVQAAALLAASTARAARFRITTPEDSVVTGRVGFVLGALRRCLVAFPGELLATLRLRRVANRAANHRAPPQRPVVAPRSVLYLRAEPTLRWMGANVGGAATHTAGVINGFADNGLGVQVVAPERPDGVADGIEVVQVAPRRVLHVVRGLSGTDYAQAVVDRLAGRRADLVYQRYALGSHAGLALAHRLGVPFVCEYNGSEIWVERHWNQSGLRMGDLLERVEERNLQAAALVVVVSDALRDEVVKRGVAPERVLVNPNGVDVGRLAVYREHDPPTWRARARLPQRPTVGFIGTFGPWHGVRLLPALVAAVPDARWVIVGDGELRGEVEAQLAAHGDHQRVTMPGLVPRARALELLAACDVCVSPHVPNPDGSRFFGSPTKLFEYMGLAKPIVAADLEQIGEVVRHEETGLLHPPGDIPTAAAAVRRLLDDAALRERLGGAALRSAQEDFSWVAHTRRILDALAPSA